MRWCVAAEPTATETTIKPIDAEKEAEKPTTDEPLAEAEAPHGLYGKVEDVVEQTHLSGGQILTILVILGGCGFFYVRYRRRTSVLSKIHSSHRV
jgi:hypothetical protein